jgi:hypothetical protein
MASPPNILGAVKESAFRRLGKVTLVAWVLLLVVGLVGVAASVVWIWVGP